MSSIGVKQKIKPAFIIPLVLVIAACGALLDQSNDVSKTESFEDEGISRTMTARAGQGGSDPEVATAIAKATSYSQELTAQAILDQSNWQATETARAPVFLELPNYGIDPQTGFVAWIDHPVIIQVSNFDDFLSANNYPEITGNDFVLAADITWNLTSSSSGCGFVFRSDGDKEEPSQYVVLLKPDSGGSLIFNAIKTGALANIMTYYPSAVDESFSWVDNSTNRLVLIAKQNILSFYTNGVKIGEIDIRNQPSDPIPIPDIPDVPTAPSYNPLFPFLPGSQDQDYSQFLGNLFGPNDPMQGYPQFTQQNIVQFESVEFYNGFISLITYNQSGFTECIFQNTWLFTIETLFSITPNNLWTETPSP